MIREKFFAYFLLGITALFVLILLYMLKPFLISILWAFIFSLVAYPVHELLSGRIKSRTLSALLITLSVLVLIVLPAFAVGFLLMQQALSLSKAVISYFQTHDYTELVQTILGHPFVKSYVKEEEVKALLEYIGSEEFKANVFALLSNLISRLGQMTTAMVLGVGNLFFKTFVFLLTFFFILRDGHKFFEFVKRVMPMDVEDTLEVAKTVYKTVIAVVYGSIAVAIVQGIAGFIGYTIVGHRYALLFAFATFLASFIPPFGAAFVWVPVAVYTFLEMGVYKGALMTLYGMLIISTIDNFVRPLVMKRGIELPYIVLFFSIVGGLLSFGFVGIFFGPILFTTTITLLSLYEKRILNKKS